MAESPRSAPAARSWLPETILLLGTDAAGKNHVAEVWLRRLGELGVSVELHEGWLAGRPSDPEAVDEKSFFSHLAEQTFLRVFPLIGWVMPLALNVLIWLDGRRFSVDGTRRLVVSHSALRILAFTLGARGRGIESLPASSRRIVRDFHRRSGATVLVLDVDPEVRQQRLQARLDRGGADPFDRYMLADPVRSERIEACLVQLAVRHMDAHLIVNNQLDDEALWAELEKGCGRGG